MKVKKYIMLLFVIGSIPQSNAINPHYLYGLLISTAVSLKKVSAARGTMPPELKYIYDSAEIVTRPPISNIDNLESCKNALSKSYFEVKLYKAATENLARINSELEKKNERLKRKIRKCRPSKAR